MPARLRSTLLALMVLLCVVLTTTEGRAQDPPPDAAQPAEQPLPPDRDSPQASVFGFIRAVNDVTARRVENLDAARERALTYLDLSLLPEGERATRGWALALQVKSALDLHGRLERGDVPDAPAARGRALWTLSTSGGAITLARTRDGWLFTAETLDRIDDIVAALEQSGAERYDAHPVARWVAERFPSLAGHALFLQHWQWLGLAALFLLAWILQRIIAYLVASVLGGVLARKGWLPRAAEAAQHAARPIGLFGVAVLLALAGPWLELPDAPVDLARWVVDVGAKLFASVGAVLVLYRLADVIAARLAEAAARTESRLDDQLVPLVRKSMKILVTVGGVLFILDNLDTDIWSLLAGASIVGVAVAFAAQDTVKNLFGSITVFLDRPFQVGDWVVSAGVEGTVEEVGFRTTRIRTFYNSLVSVPNSKFVDGIVDNLGMRRYRRFKTTIGIRYDTPPEVIEAFCHGMRQIVRANAHMRQDYFEIYLNDWGASSLDILVYVFFDVPDWDAELRERQNFMLEVIRLARDLGVGFAFPTQTLEIESTPERPLPPPAARPTGELRAIARGFGKGGERSRPEGTPDFSARARDADDEEARGSS